jgi:hypothetical protein
MLVITLSTNTMHLKSCTCLREREIVVILRPNKVQMDQRLNRNYLGTKNIAKTKYLPKINS